MSSSPAPGDESGPEIGTETGTETAPKLSLQFFLDADNNLAGAHTVGLTDHGVPELLLPMADDASRPAWSLTVSEVHDLLHGWIDAAVDGSFTTGTHQDLVLEADEAVLHLDVPAPVDVVSLPQTGLQAPATAHVLTWNVTPGPVPRALPQDEIASMAGAVNGLRLSCGLTPVPEDEMDFSPSAQYATGTPMVEALTASVRAMGAAQVASWHGAWMEVVDGGYRPDIALATCEALARRVGRDEAWDAAWSHADEVAKELLGADGPSELLMESCALLFEQVGVEDEETQHLLLGRIAVMLHDQVRVLLLSSVVEDVAEDEVTVPALQAWWSGQTLDGGVGA